MKKIRLIFLCLCMILALTGCVPSYVDEKYVKRLEADGRNRMDAFLASQFDDYELTSVRMETGMGLDAGIGTYASKVISGVFTVDGESETYCISVDLENNQFYWDYTMPILLNCAEQILSENYDFGAEIFLEGISYWQNITSHDVESTNTDCPTLTTTTQVNNVIPVYYNASNMELLAKEIVGNRMTYIDLFYVSNQDNLYDYNVLEQMQELYPNLSYISMKRVPYSVMDYWRNNGKLIGGYLIDVTEEYVFSTYSVEHTLYTREYYDKMCVCYVSQLDDDDTHYVYDSPVTVDGDVYYIEKRKNSTRIVFTEPTKNNKVKHRYVTDGEKKPKFSTYTLEPTENGYYTMKDLSYSGIYSTYSGAEIMFE